MTSPMSRPGSVSPNFQQQGTSTTYVHQNVTSPQQNYGSMLSPPPPHSFQQNHQLQSNNSSSFAEQERCRSRSGGGQQLRVQLYPRRQRSQDPQVNKNKLLFANMFYVLGLEILSRWCLSHFVCCPKNNGAAAVLFEVPWLICILSHLVSVQRFRKLK